MVSEQRLSKMKVRSKTLLFWASTFLDESIGQGSKPTHLQLGIHGLRGLFGKIKVKGVNPNKKKIEMLTQHLAESFPQ